MDKTYGHGDYQPPVEFTSDDYLRRRQVFDVVFADNPEKQQKLAEQKTEDGAIYYMQKELQLFNIGIYTKYIIGPPVRDSKVRLDQERNIVEDLESGNPVLIRGNWRAGKTSMAFSLAAHKTEDLPGLFIDVSADRSRQSIEEFKKSLRHAVASFIVEKMEGGEKDWYEKGKALEEQIKESRKDPLEYLNEYLVAHDKKGLLVLDEVVAFADNPDLLKFVAEAKKFKNIRLAVILHRLAKYEDMFTEIFKDFKTYFVKPLTEEEAGIIMRTPLNGTPIKFSDDAVKKALELSGGRPWELSTLCSAVLGSDDKDLEPKLIYTAEDFTKAAASKRNQYVFENIYRNYFKIFDYSLSEEEKNLVKRLVEDGEIPIMEVNPALVQPLLDTTYVIKDEKAGVYKIGGEMFGKYIKELLAERQL